MATSPSPVTSGNRRASHSTARMHPRAWVPPTAGSLLDVGCNAGELLADCAERHPDMRLAGVEVNPAAAATARAAVPRAEIHNVGGEALPFPDASFDCVTCIEVLEHIPSALRQRALREMHRVLVPGGRLVLRVPHAGRFAWLDSNNLRFRFPRLYGALLGRGMRDAGYAHGAEDVVWHHHFTVDELRALLGDGWALEDVAYGGLLVFPIVDILCWPFYRLRRIDNPVFRTLQRIAHWDLERDRGERSFTVLLVLARR